MVKQTLILIAVIVSLSACKTTSSIDTRTQQAAQAQGQASARIPPIVLPEACTALTERVKVRGEPWVVHVWRREVAADNRDRLARDCQAWADDYNKGLPQ